MNLNLSKPICFFDLETTGINISKDRVVEISILKVFPNGTEESKTWLVNPEMDIPKEVVEIHGITNEKLKSVSPKPSFIKSPKLMTDQERIKFLKNVSTNSPTDNFYLFRRDEKARLEFQHMSRFCNCSIHRQMASRISKTSSAVSLKKSSIGSDKKPWNYGK